MEISDNGRLLYTVGYQMGFISPLMMMPPGTFRKWGNRSANCGFYKLAQHFYGHGSGIIIKSIDNGSNWTEQMQEDWTLIFLASNDGATMYSMDTAMMVGPEMAVLKSNDSRGEFFHGTDVTGMPSLDCEAIYHEQG